MAKRALIVGCNYPNTNNELRGCVNDAHALRALLEGSFGFVETDIVMMLDTDPETRKPTGANMRVRTGSSPCSAGGARVAC